MTTKYYSATGKITKQLFFPKMLPGRVSRKFLYRLFRDISYLSIKLWENSKIITLQDYNQVPLSIQEESLRYQADTQACLSKPLFLNAQNNKCNARGSGQR